MKNKSSQKEWVLKRMREQGYISRNECLRAYISRLSSIMLNLKKEGVNFETRKVGGDYQYVLLDKPKRIDYYFVQGQEVAPPRKIW